MAWTSPDYAEDWMLFVYEAAARLWEFRRGQC